jgi:hypothetical protein
MTKLQFFDDNCVIKQESIVCRTARQSNFKASKPCLGCLTSDRVCLTTSHFGTERHCMKEFFLEHIALSIVCIVRRGSLIIFRCKEGLLRNVDLEFGQARYPGNGRFAKPHCRHSASFEGGPCKEHTGMAL